VLKKKAEVIIQNNTLKIYTPRFEKRKDIHSLHITGNEYKLLIYFIRITLKLIKPFLSSHWSKDYTIILNKYNQILN